MQKIKFISDNIVIVAINKDANVIQNLMNLHVVFENDSTKLLGEVKNIDEESIKIELLGEFVGTRFIAGTIKKPTLNSTIRVINNEELEERRIVKYEGPEKVPKTGSKNDIYNWIILIFLSIIIPWFFK